MVDPFGSRGGLGARGANFIGGRSGGASSGSFVSGAMASGGTENVFREDIAFPTFQATARGMLGAHGMWQSRRNASQSLVVQNKAGESAAERFVKIAALREQLDSNSIVRVENARSIIAENLDRVAGVAGASVGTTPTPAE